MDWVVFPGLFDAGCQHRAIIADGRKPKDLPEFNWINTVFGNLKTSLGGASILRCFLYVYSPLQPLPGLARHVGFGKLKSLSNQEQFS